MTILYGPFSIKDQNQYFLFFLQEWHLRKIKKKKFCTSTKEMKGRLMIASSSQSGFVVMRDTLASVPLMTLQSILPHCNWLLIWSAASPKTSYTNLLYCWSKRGIQLAPPEAGCITSAASDGDLLCNR